MLRVWGGGIWEPRAFFDACDEFGVLLYTDMQVSCARHVGYNWQNAAI
jgi:beta-mannosidase